MEPDITRGLVAYLSGLQGLVDLVGDRISPLRHRMGVDYPRVRYQVISAQPSVDSQGNCGRWVGELQIDCLTRSYEQAVTLFWLIHGTKAQPRLHGFGAGTWGDLAVEAATVTSFSDEWDEPIEGDDEGVYRRLIDVQVIWTEPEA